MKLLSKLYDSNPTFWDYFVIPLLVWIVFAVGVWLAGYKLVWVKR